MYCRKSSRSAQVAGAHFTLRTLGVASARGHTSAPFAPLTTARGALRTSPGASTGPVCRQSVVAVGLFPYPVSVLDVPRLNAPAGSVRSREMMQRNGIGPVREDYPEDDYPYELQLKLFGNHLVSLAEEAGRFDFRGVYTAAEVADILKVTPSKIYDLLHTKELPSVRVGHQFRIGKFVLWAYMNGMDREGLVEEILQRFVTQHCCRDGECVARGGR